MNKFTNTAVAMGAGIYANPLAQAVDRWKLAGSLPQAHFLGQMSVESENFTDLTEDLNYRPLRLLEVFRGRNGLRTLEQAQAICARGYAGVAEAVYGLPWGAKLGNTQPGDGARFPGRGLKQLTGRDNVTRYSKAQYGDDRVVRNPDMLLLPFDAAMSAAWFFMTSNAYKAALSDDVLGVTKRVNGGTNGLQARKDATIRAKRLFGI